MTKKREIGALERYRRSKKRLLGQNGLDLASSHIPTKIFSDRKVAVLEAIVEHLKDSGITYHEIAIKLNRDDRTIWTAYSRAKKKHEKLKPSAPTSIDIPLTALVDRKLSILEAVVVYLKEKRELRYSQIADLVSRDDRTIWTVYSRSKKKRGEANG